jgi:PAS domain S-box-containing protein
MSGKTTRSAPRDGLERLRQENEDLRARVEQAEATLRALAAGEVDAVVVAEPEHERVFTLETPDLPYRLAVEQMLHPAVTLTDGGTIIYANRRFAEQLGVLQSELAGKPLAVFVSPSSRTAFEILLRDARTDGMGNVRTDITLEGDAGVPLQVCLSASTLQGGALGACLVVSDLTMQRHYEELRRTQEALRASEAELREADRRKDEFMATLAHELRNPLGPMRNAVALLGAHGPLPPELEWARGVLDRQVRTMARLLDDLLDVARISRNTLELRKERIQLAAVLEAALETSRPLIAAGRHELVYAGPTEPIHVHADPVRLSQVFGNLLNNAAKYTEPGGRIEIRVRRDAEQTTVSIKDTGIGISPEVLPHIFEIFTQAEQAIDRSQGGLGIGLSLVKGLVDLHGGSVEAKSDGAGQGTEFLVRLPSASA